MESIGAKEFSTLADYVAVLRRRRAVVLVAVCLVPVAALLFSLRQHKVYEASADVLLSRTSLASVLTGTPDQNAGQDPERFAQTQASLARVPPVLQAAVRRANIPGATAGELLDSSSAEPVLNADLLRFKVKNGDPKIAVPLVNAYAQEFTRYRAQLDTSSLARTKQEVLTELARLRRAGVNKRSGLYLGLLDKEQQLTILQSLQIGNTSLVRRAESAGQVAPRPVRNGILGFFFGVVLGIGLAFLVEALDRRVRSHGEIERTLRIPFLGWLPKSTEPVGNGISPVMLASPHSGAAGRQVDDGYESGRRAGSKRRTRRPRRRRRLQRDVDGVLRAARVPGPDRRRSGTIGARRLDQNDSDSWSTRQSLDSKRRQRPRNLRRYPRGAPCGDRFPRRCCDPRHEHSRAHYLGAS